MITNFSYQKTVENLRMRMLAVKRSYRIAFRYSFIGGLAIFGWEALYYFFRVSFMSAAWVREKFAGAEYSDEWHIFLPNAVLLIAPLLCAVLGFFSFRQKYRVVKIISFILSLIFLGSFIILLCMGFDKTSFISAIVFTAGHIALTVNCFIKDADDASLSKIDGYPDFDPLLMQDMAADTGSGEKLRFRDKGEEGYKDLLNERDGEYIENNPKSEMALIMQKEKEEERERRIGDWLDEIIGK